MTTTLESVSAEFADCINRTAPEDPTGSYFAVGTPAMRGNVIAFDEARRISKETYAQWTRRLRPVEGDLLIAREAPVGPVVRIPSGEKIAAGQRTTHIRPDPSKVDPRFLYYYLIAPETQRRLEALSMGSTVPHLRVGDVRSFELANLPPTIEQRAIGEVLGALDDKIATNRAAITAGKELMQVQWAQMSAAATRSYSLDEVVELNPRTRLAVEGPHPFLDMKDLPQNGLLADRWSERESRSGSKFRNGDTLLARITPCFENGKAGLVDFLPPEVTGMGSTEYIVFRPKDGTPQAIAYCIATSESFRAHAARGMTGTSGRQRVQAANIGDYPVGWPEQNVIDGFGGFSDALVRRLSAARNENSVLARTRDDLLPLLMDGRITVEDAERAAEPVL